MNKLTTFTIIATVAIFIFQDNITKKHFKNEKSTFGIVVSGNKTVHRDFVLKNGMISPEHS